MHEGGREMKGRDGVREKRRETQDGGEYKRTMYMYMHMYLLYMYMYVYVEERRERERGDYMYIFCTCIHVHECVDECSNHPIH